MNDRIFLMFWRWPIWMFIWIHNTHVGVIVGAVVLPRSMPSLCAMHSMPRTHSIYCFERVMHSCIQSKCCIREFSFLRFHSIAFRICSPCKSEMSVCVGVKMSIEMKNENIVFRLVVEKQDRFNLKHVNQNVFVRVCWLCWLNAFVGWTSLVIDHTHSVRLK